MKKLKYDTHYRQNSLQRLCVKLNSWIDGQKITCEADKSFAQLFNEYLPFLWREAGDVNDK